jgi:Protein of unknown function (DUF3097)
VSGILGGTPDQPRRAAARPVVEAAAGLVVMHRGSRTRGVIASCNAEAVTVTTPTGGERIFRLLPEGFVVDGAIVNLVAPKRKAPAGPAKRTASGSVAAATPARARVARASRIWVEGIHDAELVEKVWGDDLREAGIVVERLDGIDDLVEEVRDFGPGPDRRLGILVDHLVPGSKEWRLAEAVKGPFVTVTGTPYIDVWQAVRPRTVGIDAWPNVPRGEEWKAGVCRRLGWTDVPGMAWKRILGSVRTFADLEPAVVGAIEELFDTLLNDG